ncbi:3-ketoacyl-CoA synthase 19-like [Corylus avellana]|uniref:3-ketoacyl-CoA synthase 19-like n=1 Tax=Corylus avellana TaxID=13451 RepID=UPI001E204F45|nr:3-ketoacyl-CoA synthase 19-like [Corylus avellana]
MDLFMGMCFLALFYAFFCICKLVLQRRGQGCYMLAYECYKPPEERKLNTGSCAKIVFRNKNLGLEEYRFLLKTIVSSGLGEETYGPPIVFAEREQEPTLADAHLEMKDFIFDTLDKLFARTGVSPSEIDILAVNVSMFAPVPSLTASIINRYKMRENIKAFNLSGMGCSASLVAVDLVRHLFKSYKESYAIVVSTESMGPHWYCGREKSMLLSNCLFRSGSCSMLLTNKRALKHRAILRLKSVVRTDLGSNDEAYECCMQVEDDHGNLGFRLTKGLTKAAAQAFSNNLRILVPKLLPLRELLRQFFVAKLEKNIKKTTQVETLNLKSGVDHFCIHPGGRAVIDGVGKGLGLNDYDLEPARMALHRFGNTSAAGNWYVLSYMEAKKRLKKGDKILMISLGAGFMCNNCVWEVMRDLDSVNVWKDCIENYPPQCLVNPFKEKYSWINDECLNFVRLH